MKQRKKRSRLLRNAVYKKGVLKRFRSKLMLKALKKAVEGLDKFETCSMNLAVHPSQADLYKDFQGKLIVQERLICWRKQLNY